MKCLTIQVQLDRIADFDEAGFLNQVRSHGCYPEIDRSEINTPDFDQPYINFNFFTDELKVLWPKLHNALYLDPAFGPQLTDCTIVACEGDNGWDNYLTLHHYDAEVAVDTLIDTGN